MSSLSPTRRQSIKGHQNEHRHQHSTGSKINSTTSHSSISHDDENCHERNRAYSNCSDASNYTSGTTSRASSGKARAAAGNDDHGNSISHKSSTHSESINPPSSSSAAVISTSIEEPNLDLFANNEQQLSSSSLEMTRSQQSLHMNNDNQAVSSQEEQLNHSSQEMTNMGNEHEHYSQNYISRNAQQNSSHSPPQHPQHHPQYQHHQQENHNNNYNYYTKEETEILNQFWKTYDNILILSLFSIIGIIIRLIAANFFVRFDDVFNEDSALFTNLPLNCMSCFIMGLLCSGRDAMRIVYKYGYAKQLTPDLVPCSSASVDVVASSSSVLEGGVGIGLSHTISEDEPNEYGIKNDGIRLRQVQYQQQEQQNDTCHSRRRRSKSKSTNNVHSDEDDDSSQIQSTKKKKKKNKPLSPKRRGKGSWREKKKHYYLGNTDNETTFDTTTNYLETASSSSTPNNQNNNNNNITHTNYNHKNASSWFANQREADEAEMREVQLMALERRIRASECLFLFPCEKEDVDVVEHYHSNSNDILVDGEQEEEEEVDDGDDTCVTRSMFHRTTTHSNRRMNFENGDHDDENRQQRSSVDFTITPPPPQVFQIGGDDDDDDDIVNDEQHKDEECNIDTTATTKPDNHIPKRRSSSLSFDITANNSSIARRNNTDTSTNQQQQLQQPRRRYLGERGQSLDDFDFDDLQTITSNYTTTTLRRLTRINVADGWDVNSSVDSMKECIILGLRVGFCGAVSTFSSWNSDMVNLLKRGKVDAAFVGYLIGIQLPIISYRFGQHVAVYTFIWRCRRELLSDERRGGYGLRVKFGDEDDDDDDNNNTDDQAFSDNPNTTSQEERKRSASMHERGEVLHRNENENILSQDTPSLRAIITAFVAMIVVCLLSSLVFFGGNLSVQRFSISLLFTPFGVLARWRLNATLNNFHPSFPLGTFFCNILAVALSGSLGSLLAGNPGPEERIVLVSIIAGFAGSLSTLTSFLVEVLDRIDPILLKFDGVQYIMVTIFWAIIIGFLGSQAKNWADKL